VKNIDFDKAIERVKKIEGIKKDREIAPLFGLSPQDLSNRKKRGTLRSCIIEWAAKKGISINLVLYGEDDIGDEKTTSEGGNYQEEISNQDSRMIVAEPPDLERRLLKAFRLLDQGRQSRIVDMAEDMSVALSRGSEVEQGVGDCAESK